MNATKCRKQLALAIAVLCCGCSAEPASAPWDQPSTPDRPPTKILLDELEYHDPIIRERVHRVDALARRIADPKSHHLAWHENWHAPHTSSTGKPWMSYNALWCLQSDRPDHVCGDATERPVHCINLRTSPHPDNPKKLRGLGLNVNWHPGDGGWGIRMSYHTSKPYADSAAVSEQFSITFYRRELPRDPGSEIALSLPGGGYRAKKRFGQFEYVVAAPTNSGPGPRDPRKFLASPESLRDAGLSEIDALEPVIREQIISGEAVRSVTDHSKIEERTVDAMRGGIPPEKQHFNPTFQPPLAPEYELSEQQKQAVLVEAITELDRRRRILREHYQEMYAAVQAAFPLNESLAAEVED